MPGDPRAAAILGKVMYFDKNLSVNRNTACAFCHMPETGFQGAIESINRTTVNQPAAVRTRFSARKPPTAAYAALAPPLYYRASSGDFVGGNFWDLRATGMRLRNPAASQAQGSPINPTEMANPEPACVVRRLQQRPYRAMFEQVLGPRSFQIHWPADVDAVCSRPNNDPATRIGSEVPGPNNTPWVVKLAAPDRVPGAANVRLLRSRGRGVRSVARGVSLHLEVRRILGGQGEADGVGGARLCALQRQGALQSMPFRRQG